VSPYIPYSISYIPHSNRVVSPLESFTLISQLQPT
jgi:hypothetical protein